MDTTPIKARLSVIANCLNALRALRPLTYEEFAHDYIPTGAAERNFQVAIQAALDIASLILADQTTFLAKEYKDLFPALAQIGILLEDFAQRLVAMAKFRNVLLHLYLEVDLQRLYRYLQENLDDFQSFARYEAEWLQAHAEE